MQKKYEELHLDEYLMLRLEELREELSQDAESEFLLGQAYAFVECLEVILKSNGENDEELLSIERRYGLR